MTRQRAFLMSLVTLLAGVAIGATAVILVRPAPATTANLSPTPSAVLSPSPSPVAAPSTRFRPSMAFDASAGKVVLFGGSSSDVNGVVFPAPPLLADTWTWSSAGWRQEQPAVSPPARAGAAMVYDPKSSHVLMWGGLEANGPGFDFWTWDGTSWSQIRTTSGPSPDNNPGWSFPAPVLMWDSARNVIELIRNNGGHPAGPGQPDVWYWDESHWTQGSGQGAPAAWGTAAFDSHAAKVVFYGATANMQPTTYTYDSIGWTRTTAALTPPVQLDDPPPLAFFAPAGRTVAVEPNGDVWSFDGVDWSQTSSGTLPNTKAYAVTYDDALRAVVLFGGSQTWTWDGTSWAKR